MRPIAVIINNLGFGGAERLVVDEVNELHRRRIAVILITLRPEGEARTFMQSCTIPAAQRYHIPFASLFDARGYFKLVSLLRRAKTDTVITHLWFSNTIGRIACFFARAPRVISFEHNVYDRVKTGKQFLIDRLLQGLSARIVAVSEAVRDSLVAHRISAGRIIVIENGIDLARYREARPANVRHEKNLGNETLFLFVGRLIEQKGVDILLDAFAHVGGGYLLIAGDGIKRSALENRSRNLEIDSRVFFLGARNDVPSLMKAADCLVLPSRWEGQGIVIPEAFAAGLPVIIADFPAGHQMVKNGENGIVVPRENAAALRDAMELMRTDAKLRQKLANAAKREAGRFGIQRHTDKLLSYAS